VTGGKRKGFPPSRPKRKIRENQTQPEGEATVQEAVTRRGWFFAEDLSPYASEGTNLLEGDNERGH